MSEAVPKFFFSYSRADCDPYLEGFFKDLRKKVADRAGMGIAKDDPDAEDKLNKVGFRDAKGVKTGQDWKTIIGRAIQRNGILVCLYSPNFFTQNPDKQFCGRELTAFLRRHPDFRPDGQPAEAPGTRHILPILWLDLRSLSNHVPSLPPSCLRLINWSLDGALGPNNNDKYIKKGLRLITKGRGVIYEQILDTLADQINEVARAPLPPLPELPDLETLPSAWAPAAASDAATSQAARADAAAAGPCVIRIVVVGPEGESVWSPYGEDALCDLLRDWASRRVLDNRPAVALDWRLVDPGAADLEQRLMALLQDAEASGVRPVLVVDPRSLAHETARAALSSVVQAPWRAGLLAPQPIRAEEAAAFQDTIGALERQAQSDWLLKTHIGNQEDFRTAADSVAGDLLSAIVAHQQVRRPPPENQGPLARPRISNQEPRR